MKTPYHSIILAAAFAAALFSPTALACPADASAPRVAYAGVPEQGIRAEADQHVLTAAFNYLLLKSDSDVPGGGVYTWQEARAQFRKAILQYPDEVNDCLYGCGHLLPGAIGDGLVGLTPLWVAACLKDTELVILLLEKGAYPFCPDAGRLERIIWDPNTPYELRMALSEARQKYNVLEAVIQSRNCVRRENH